MYHQNHRTITDVEEREEAHLEEAVKQVLTTEKGSHARVVYYIYI